MNIPCLQKHFSRRTLFVSRQLEPASLRGGLPTNRRLLFGLFVLALVLTSFLAGCGSGGSGTSGSGSGGKDNPKDGRSAKPNIVLILADDMGYSDLGCMGSSIQTPNIDELAETGLLFTQFYNAGRCCPSRASLLTGMYSHKAGIGHMAEQLDHPAYRGFLNDHCLTIAEALRSAGYATYMAGKWHVGTDRPHWPLQRGFDKFYGSNTSQGHYFRVYEGRKLLYGNEEISTPDGWYATDAFTDSTVAFIRQHHSEKKDQPFFMYLAYTAPHWPIQALPEDIRKYEDRYRGGYDSTRRERYRRMKETEILERPWELSPADERTPGWATVGQKEEARKMAVYAAMIDRMDQGIGRITAALKELGLEENTMIVFLSDNGGSAEEIHRSQPGARTGDPGSYESIGLPWAGVANTPFRKFKSWVHEGGISTPLIIRYPTLIPQGGRKIRQAGHIIDLMPTFLELAGVSYPSEYEGRELYALDGKSLLPLLKDENAPGHELLFWEHEGNRAVRQGKWKLVSGRDGNWELYDMEKDRTETTGLKAQYPEKAAELAKMYEEWATRNRVLPWEEVKALRRSASSDK